MPSVDMPLEEMRQYKPPLQRPGDFEPFWKATVDDALRQPVNAELIPYALPARGLQCYAVRFDGYAGPAKTGGRIAGWYVRPEREGRYPGLCMYHGYSGRALRPLEVVHLASQGICVLTMDTRGQNGQSQDASVPPEGQVSGWMTRGIRDPATYYFRYVYADAVRALELLANREEIDPSRLAITGTSQGGAITLAVAALSDRPMLAMPDVPFLCDFKRSIAVTPVGPYAELPQFFRSFPAMEEQAMRTLSYVDCMNLAPWIKCRTIVSNCLWDDVCLPSTIFATYNHIAAEKQIEIYPYHKHEVPFEHKELQFRVLREVLLG